MKQKDCFRLGGVDKMTALPVYTFLLPLYHLFVFVLHKEQPLEKMLSKILQHKYVFLYTVIFI